MSNILRIGVIGAGGIAKYAHIPSYKMNVACKLIAISNVNEKARRDALEKFNVPRVYENTLEMLNTEELDAVSICTPPNSHADLVRECARRHIHILCEKPLALSTDETERLIKECQKNDVILAVGYTLRFHSNLELIKKWLMQGKLGQLYSIISVYHRPPPRNKWIYNPEISGGGVIMDLGSHVIDLHNWLVKDEVENLSVFVNTYGKTMNVENMASIILKYRNNITTKMSLSWLAPQEMVEHFIVCSNAIVKTNGIMELRYRNASELYKLGNKALMRVRSIFRLFPFRKSNPYQAEINDFVDSIIKHKQPRVTAQDDLRVRKLVERIYNLI